MASDKLSQYYWPKKFSMCKNSALAGECANPSAAADDEFLRFPRIFPGRQPLLWKARNPLLHTGCPFAMLSYNYIHLAILSIKFFMKNIKFQTKTVTSLWRADDATDTQAAVAMPVQR